MPDNSTTLYNYFVTILYNFQKNEKFLLTKVISSYINVYMSDIKDFLALPDDVKKHFQELFRKKLDGLLFDSQHNVYFDRQGVVTVEQYKTMKMLCEV